MTYDATVFEYFITTRPARRSRRRKGVLIRFRNETWACSRLAKRREAALAGMIRRTSYRLPSKAFRGSVHPAYLGK